jgi:hypothetical protein
MNKNKSGSYSKQLYGRRKFQITKWNHSKIKMKLKDDTPLASQIINHQVNDNLDLEDSGKQFTSKSPLKHKKVIFINI